MLTDAMGKYTRWLDDQVEAFRKNDDQTPFYKMDELVD